MEDLMERTRHILHINVECNNRNKIRPMMIYAEFETLSLYVRTNYPFHHGVCKKKKIETEELNKSWNLLLEGVSGP